MLALLLWRLPSEPVRLAHPGEGDATTILQEAFRSDASTIVVPHVGRPWITGPLHLSGSSRTVILEPGVVLEAKRGAFRDRRDALLTVDRARDVRLLGAGATFVMHREDYERAPYEPSEWRHAIVVRGSQRIEIAGLGIEGAGGDGLYLGRSSDPSDPVNGSVWIHHVVVRRSLRQGLSVISARGLTVEDSVFGWSGPTAPAAGIDIEPNHPDEVADAIVVRRCLLLQNMGIGMHVWLRHLDDDSAPVSIRWEENLVVGGRVGIHGTGAEASGLRGVVVFRHNVILGAGREAVHLRKHEAPGLALRVEANVIAGRAPPLRSELRGADQDAEFRLHNLVLRLDL